jgi:alkylation response protein AidB-like acyl-CoA dehydrogenase
VRHTSNSGRRTGKTDPQAGHRGISLLAVERGMPGFTRGRNLDKIGMKSRDTAELFFDQVPVPKTNLIGELNRGFYHLMSGLTQERLACAVTSAAIMERALQLTCAFVRTRRVYGQPLGALQNTQFKLAEVQAAAQVCRVFTDHAISEHLEGRLTSDDNVRRPGCYCSKLHGSITTLPTVRPSPTACSCPVADGIGAVRLTNGLTVPAPHSRATSASPCRTASGSYRTCSDMFTPTIE